MMKRKGFTLIELLVVIAIIGLLSTLAVVSLNSARAKARDAKRISDVKQLSMVIEMEAANSLAGGYDVFATDTCETASDLTTACGADFGGVNWADITDPSGTTACVTATPQLGCAYTMGVTASFDAYEICFFLEEGTPGTFEGLNSVGPGGIISAGCSI